MKAHEMENLSALIVFSTIAFQLMASIGVGFLTRNAGYGFLTLAAFALLNGIFFLIAFKKLSKDEEEKEPTEG